MIDYEDTTSIELRLAVIERGIDSIIRNVTAANSRAKKAKRSAQSGSVRDLFLAINELSVLVTTAKETIDEVQAQCDFDATDWMASGAYQKEFLELAADEGLHAIESDGRILCYPTIMQLSTTDATVLLDKKKERGIRPSYLIDKLKTLSQRQIRFRADVFIEVLVLAYDLVVAEKKRRDEAVVKLQEIYRVLTILPSSRSYSKSEFARDVYLLDQSGITLTRDRRTLKLPASALTRSSGTMETVAKGGQVKLYAGIAFEALHD
ncbi:MAG: hypothetical protein ACYDHP_12665 [Ferrimicrobium sp.]